MADFIEVDIITTVDTDTDLDTTITMGTDILTDVVTERSLDVTGIIRIRASIITVIDITRAIIDTIRTLDITKIILRTIGLIQITERQQIPETKRIQETKLIPEIEVIPEAKTTELPEQKKLEHTDSSFYLSSMMRGLNYPAILSKIFPTIKPPNVPTIYPIIAISTPMGISALE